MSAADHTLSRRDYVDSAGASIYYEEHGAGRPLILAPGWTFTTEVYQRQIAHFSPQYRTIAYDPRSHGRSSITLDGNTYMQHGRDLAALNAKLDLAHFVFIGWSAGCFDGYAYVRQYGPEKLDAFICIDQPPKTFVEHEGERGLGNYPRWRDIVNGVQYTRVAAAERLARRLLTREISPPEKEWLVRQSLTTPTFAAVNLLADSAYADYRPEVQQLG
jgi:pimeloyl-ACP methyl ester carboxylesterase